ncbi:MAG TPA: adenylate/guanylate cyclase domain-containing protein [Candidatus Binatia bacterium]|nr:adenylate/guanylate cyclase domain-containing protein [Candidatus Binatia bacterium]
MRRAFAFLGLLLIFAALAYFNTFSQVRSDLSDRLYGGAPALSNIVLVTIDDASISALGRWPWERDVFAALLEKVQDARAIGVDVSFFEPSVSDERLNGTLASLPNVVLAAEIQEGTLVKPIFAADSGYVNLITDPDGITRRVELRKDALPFAFLLYKKGWDANAAFDQPTYRINFADVPGTFSSVSVRDALTGNQSFKDKFVLIGATAANLHDEYFVPTSEGRAMPGIEIHANILQNLLLKNFIVKQGVLGLLIVLVIAGAIGMFLLPRLPMKYAVILGLAAIIVYGLIAAVAFHQFQYLMDIFFVPLALIIFTSAGVGLNYFEEQQQTAYLRDAFSKYVSKELLNELLSAKQELKLGGTRKDITVFFSDIRGFTTMSEKTEPEALVQLLNEYFTSMTRIILKHQGTVDKFIGDAIMAFWNAPVEEPNHATLACTAALEQVEALKVLQKKWSERGVPVIHIGCGINTGPAIIGNMGSEERFDYTAIGDTVNLASRLEGLTKEHHADIIISKSTYEQVKESFHCKKLGSATVKGKEKPVVIYSLVGKK